MVTDGRARDRNRAPDGDRDGRGRDRTGARNRGRDRGRDHDRDHDRGQAHTLEAVVAGILLLAGVVFALQVTAVTPLSASTSSQHLENQQQAAAEGALVAAHETGALERAVLFWNASNSSFHGAGSDQYYTSEAPPNAFGDVLERVFSEQGIAYNVYVGYQTARGDRRRQAMTYNGAPSDNAVSASRTVTLYDDDRLYDENETATSTALTDTTSFYAPDAAGDSSVYNVLEVEVVVWRQ